MSPNPSEEPAKTETRDTAARKSKVLFTAIQHGSGLLIFLGLFLAIPTYLSNPNSGLVTVGFGIAIVGIVGVLFGIFMSRRNK